MTNSASKSKQIAEGLLGIKAVFLSPNESFYMGKRVSRALFTVIIDLHSLHLR